MTASFQFSPHHLYTRNAIFMLRPYHFMTFPSSVIK
jgi:hypothetical protein